MVTLNSAFESDHAPSNPLGVSASSSLGALAKALAQAQGAFALAHKDKLNHFQAKYADLAGFIEVCRKPLSDNGLAVSQTPIVDLVNKTAGVCTLLLHESGEFLSSTLVLPIGDMRPHSVGSCISYARRYALAAVLGLASYDDDAASASAPEPSENAAPARRNGQGNGIPVRPVFTGVAKNPPVLPSRERKAGMGPSPAPAEQSADTATPREERSVSETDSAASPSSWRDVVMVGGPNKGKPLGSLDEEYLNELFAKWRPANPSPAGQAVLDALQQRQRELEQQAEQKM